MALENTRRSIYRTDTAPIFNQPDYAGMYERQALNARNEQRYQDQMTRQRQQDFAELTKVSLDPSITDEALKGYELDNYNQYMGKVKELAKARGGKLTNEDIVNIRMAQGMMLKAQGQAKDAQARWAAAGKTLQDPRNEGLYDEDYYNAATENMRKWFKSGGKEGEIPQSFLDMTAENAKPYFGKLRKDMETTSYSYTTKKNGQDITHKYETTDLTPEEAADIIVQEGEKSRRLRKGIIEDWKEATDTGKLQNYRVQRIGYLHQL